MREKTEVLVIGGGIAGLMTAWYLAQDGVEVTLVEAGDLGAQASGANAGSLHLQLQFAEFVGYGEDWARAYAPTLLLLTTKGENFSHINIAFRTDSQWVATTTNS